MLSYKLYHNHVINGIVGQGEIKDSLEFLKILKNHKESCGDYSAIVILENTENKKQYIYLNLNYGVEIVNVFNFTSDIFKKYERSLTEIAGKRLTLKNVERIIKAIKTL